LERRLAAVEVDPRSIEALLITHDHADHTRGMGIFARRWGTPLYLTSATRAACAGLLAGTERVREYRSSEPVAFGPLVVEPFLTLHDAVDPLAVTVTEAATGEKLGIATDLGRATATVRHALRECNLLLLEANHDEILLRDGPYPWSVKARIGGSHGHLSNRAAAEIAVDLHHSGLAMVVLAHLSESSNDPALALDGVGVALERMRFRGSLAVAPQEGPLEPIDLGALRRSRLPAQISLF
ncbi:MAG: MBL fold metallo-hydrolase, partial [Gemmatimonadota bacterium]|nr:MBL fold metallo-hydrolase [Gemmatimonadota bacterium]